MTLVVQKPAGKLPVEDKDGHLTVKGTGKDDKISIMEKNGKLYVKSSHREAVLDPKQIKSLTIDGRNGNDTTKGILGDKKINDRGGKNAIVADRGNDSVTVKNRQDNRIERLHSTRI